MPRFAANLSMVFTEIPFIERFAVVRKTGFDVVEFLFPYNYSILQIQGQLKQDHLTLALFNTASGGINAKEWGLSALPGRKHEVHADIDLAPEYILASNYEQIHAIADVMPAGEDAERCRAVFIDNIRYTIGRFAPHGKRILVGALSSGVRPHYLFSSRYQVLVTAGEVARDNVSIQLDAFHVQKVDDNLTRLAHDYTGKYAHVRITGLPDRHEPDDGEINYPWLFRLFDEVGYQGWIGCEYKPRGLIEEGLGWLGVWR